MHTLIEVMREAGLSVSVEVWGTADPEMSTLVDWSAYRIIQQALTNVAQYAPHADVQVTIEFDDGWVGLAVIDDGGSDAPPRRRANGDGRGLVGIRERVAVLGGTLDAAPVDGGFAVRARLPSRGRLAR
jgi:signal transduction histidine kinase